MMLKWLPANRGFGCGNGAAGPPETFRGSHIANISICGHSVRQHRIKHLTRMDRSHEARTRAPWPGEVRVERWLLVPLERIPARSPLGQIRFEKVNDRLTSLRQPVVHPHPFPRPLFRRAQLRARQVQPPLALQPAPARSVDSVPELAQPLILSLVSSIRATYSAGSAQYSLPVYASSQRSR